MHPSASHILPNLTGEFIDDGYLELLCLLGSGAYGKVYKALDTTSAEHDLAYYAVKCMPRYRPGTREAEIQDNEISVHRMVSDHPRVITFHRHFFTDEFVFVILELCTGGDLFDAMVDKKLFRGNPTRIKKAFGELLDAVEFIHRNSVYHRDIKPENILCNSAGTDLRLADFGLSTQVSVSTQFGCGSKFYMSPESFGRVYSCYSARHSDLWALGMIFANMISGRHPWHSAELSDPAFAAFRAHKNSLLKPLRITRPANALLERCFHANPLRRPTLAQFREAINAIDSFSLEDPLIVAPPCIPLPQFPVQFPVTSTSAAGGECEKTPKPAFPIHMPQPLRPFVLASSSSSQVAGPPPSPSSSSSVPSSDWSAPSLVSAADSTPPVTRSTLLTQSGDMRMCNIPALAGEPLPALCKPKPVYFGLGLGLGRGDVRLPVPSVTTEYRTVASNGRPTLPTRRQFLTARRIQVRE